MLFEHAPQLDRHRLLARERHWHVRNEPANVARGPAIGSIALRERVGVAEE